METDKNNNSIGIISAATYLPAMRLRREAIVAAIGWAAPGLKALAKGERSVANWDEDSITMAVEAARDCLSLSNNSAIGRLMLASSTLPFSDRSNSGLVKAALNLPDGLSNNDFTGSRRAATTALLNMLSMNNGDNALLIASDCREAKPGSNQEMLYGHGAAALLLGRDDPIAIPVGGATIHSDLVDQYRKRDSRYDYVLEERWARSEGHLRIIPDAIACALKDAGMQGSDINHLVLPGSASIAKSIAAKSGLEGVALVDSLTSSIGDCGVPHPLLMLTQVLQYAKPGEHILLIGFGQGADVLILKVTDSIIRYQESSKSKVTNQQGRKTDNYLRYLVIRKQLNLDYGMRAERDNRTALSAYYRNRETVTGFNGGRCSKCGTLQFPKTQACVSCREFNTQESESFSGLTGSVKSFTEDWLAYTPSPPLIYGNITFQDGANVMMEMTDVEAGDLSVGTAVRMAFRIKDIDERRDFQRYFWKAVPVSATEGKADG